MTNPGAKVNTPARTIPRRNRNRLSQFHKILNGVRAYSVLAYFAAAMLRFFYLIICSMICAVSVCGQAQAYLLEALTYRQGLSDNRVRSIMQDEKGFLWIGTAYGLNRYDGYTFWHYLPEKTDSTSISDHAVNEIVKDKNGVLWMATGNGICRLRPGPWKFERIIAYPKQIGELRSAYFENVYPDPDGHVWATNTSGQLFFIFPDEHRFETIELPAVPNPPATVPAAERMKPARPVWVEACGDTAVLIGSNYGLFQFHKVKRTFRFFPVEAAWPFGLSHISPDGPGAFWCATYLNGLVHVEIPSGRVAHYPHPEPTPHGIMTFSDGRVWIAGVSGLTEFRPQHNNAEKIKLPFEGDVSLNADCFFKDRAGTIWIGTDNGLVKYDPRLQGFHYTEVHRETSTIYENDIYDVCHDTAEGLWFVVSRQQSAIYVLDRQNRLRRRISTMPYSEPTRIFRDSKGRIWVTTRYQVLRFDPKTYRLSPVPTPPRRENRAGLIWTVAEDALGRLWFGISRDGLFIYDPADNTTQIPGPEDGFSALRVAKIVADRNGRFVWVATDGGGVYECDLKTMKFHRYGEETDEGLVSISALVQDAAGQLWVGTVQSLLRYDPLAPKDRAFRNFTVADGLPMNYVEGGISDYQGRLWFGAGDRLVRIDPKTLQIKTFDYRYGTSKSPFGYFDFSISPNGELYAGGRRGFLRWRPDNLLDNQEVPTVVVTNLKVAREDVPAPTSEVGRIWLQSNENNFRVEFAALNFTLPDDNLYQWKMDGYDKNWSPPSQQREAIYAHIPPGTYQLLVKAANSDGVWNQNPLAIKVQIFPAFWQTWWFRVSVLLALGGLIYAFIRWRINLVQDRERLQSAYNQRLAEVEMSALRAQMNPHFVFNCLNSINRYILLNQPLVASQYLTKFARLIRLVLDNSKSEMISLEKELETLRLYIEMEAVRFEGRFQYNIQIDEAIDPGSLDIPPMLIQPYVENAIWHGLLHRKGNDGQLDIQIKLEHRDMIIWITDNGVGREAAQALKSKSASEHKSHGMTVTAERLKLLSNLYNREIHAQVHDLLQRDGSAAGTRVILTIPVLG